MVEMGYTRFTIVVMMINLIGERRCMFQQQMFCLSYRVSSNSNSQGGEYA